MNPRAPRFLSLLACMLLAAITITFSGCGKDKSTGPTPGPTATVSGIVQNSAGSTPIEGASVRASSGATATTNALGRFTISVAANQRVRIDVTKTDFSLNQAVVQLAPGASKSLAVALMDAGTTSSVAASAGGSVTDLSSNAVLTLPADFVVASGSVNVTVTGLDPTTEQIRALPGGLDALDANGQPVYLSPVSFAEYTVTDASGNVLPFNPSASAGADIELPIPAALAGQPGYEDGDPIECYVYDPADGKWKTPVPGVIGPSSVNGDLAIKATIFHLSWYGGAPASSDVGCVEGIVRLNGAPLANVDVEAFPGGNTTTDANGHYQVQAALNSDVRVVATQSLGTTFRMAEGSVHVGGPAPCANLDLNLGDVQAGEYHVEAFMTTSSTGGPQIDLAFAYIYLEAGSQQVGVTGATVQVGTGSTWYTLTPSTAGYYTIATGTGGFALTPGALYTVRVDFTADGSYDASGQVRMVGQPEFTTPAANATVASQFTAAWDDPGTSVGGYSASYFGIISPASGDSVTTYFVTTSRTKVIGNGVPDPLYQFPNDPLLAGDYEFEMFAANGPYWYFLADTSFTPNVTGTNATGYFSAIAVAEPVLFSSSGAGATGARRAAATEMRRWKLPARLESAMRRAEANHRFRASTARR